MAKRDLYKETLAAIDGVEQMDDTSASLVRWAQSTFGNAGGDTARFIVQAPESVRQGVMGGLETIAGGLSKMYADGGDRVAHALMLSGQRASMNPLTQPAVPTSQQVKQARQSLEDNAKKYKDSAAKRQSFVSSNYQTDTGRAAGGGLYSAGAAAPGLIGSVAVGNPAPMMMYGGAQSGIGGYHDARNEGLSVPASAGYGAAMGGLEAATERLGVGGLLDAVAGKGVVRNLVKSQIGEQVGEQAATLGQDFLQSAVIDSRKNDKWFSDYVSNRPSAAYDTAIGSLVAGGVNPAIAFTANAAKDVAFGSKGAIKSNGKTGRDLYKETMAVIDNSPATSSSQNTIKANQFLLSNVLQGNFANRADIPSPRQLNQQNLKYRQVSPKTQADLRSISKNPNVRKMLNLISHTEGTEKHGYNTLVGGERINDLSRHPNKVGLVTKDGASTAFGRYQIVGKTWRGLQKQYGFTDMQPESQDAAAVALLHQRGALNDVLNGNYKSAINKLGNEWVSLPSSTNKNQGKRSWARVDKFLAGQGASMGADGQQVFSDGLNDDLPIEGAKIHNDSTMGDMEIAYEDSARAMQAAAEEQEYQARRAGRATRVFLDGKMQDATLELMDADDLTPAIADTDNQYRDRSRAASQMQINQIANNLEPELLGDSKQIDSGAPTLAADGKTIIGGNGRVMAINQAYENGNGENYRQYLMDNAEQFGINPDDIQAMGKPVLVRRFADSTIDTNKAAVASNEGGGLGMSSLEQARVDAERLPDFGSFIPAENGELNTPANRGFIRDFVGGMPTTVQAQMIGADGQLSQDGVRRLRNALLYSAYGNSPALSRMVESTDSGLKNMVNAMMQAAPAIAKAKNHIKDGAMHDADISEDIVSAVEKINQIHENGGSVADYLAQQGMFEDDLSPVARDLVAFFDEYKRSAKAISTLLKNYYDLLAAQGNPAEADIFGDSHSPEKHKILQESKLSYEQQYGKSKQEDIFSGGKSGTTESEQRPVGKSYSEAEQQPDGSGSNEAGTGENTGGIEQQNIKSDQVNYSRTDSTRVKYEHRIDELFNGAKAERFGGVTVLDRSDMLDMLGYGNMPLRLVEGKVIAGQKNHPMMTADVWKKIPDWVDNPAMVFDSDTVAGRLVFIAPEKVRGNDVRIVVEPNGDELQAHMLVNAYDKDTSSPYLRWANDRLLRYVDKAKAARINERFGLQLPDILKNPSLAPDARIHGTGRGNAKDLRPSKILTEKNLQGYRKNNPDSVFERDEVKPSEKSTEKINEFERAIVAALGKKNAAFVDVVSLADVSRPENAADLLNVQGWYDAQTGRITLIAENLKNADTAKFVAWHELAHRKISVSGWQQWQSLFKQVDGNNTVKRLADAIMKQRRSDKDAAALNRIVAVEEAIAELYAANKESNFEALEGKYGINLSPSFKDGLSGYLSRLANRIKNILKDALGIPRDVFSDDQVFKMLRRIDTEVDKDSEDVERELDNGNILFSRTDNGQKSTVTYEIKNADLLLKEKYTYAFGKELRLSGSTSLDDLLESSEMFRHYPQFAGIRVERLETPLEWPDYPRGMNYDAKNKVLQVGRNVKNVDSFTNFLSKNLSNEVKKLADNKHKEAHKDTDARYLELAKRYEQGDKTVESELRKMVDKQAEENGFDDNSDFRMQHTAPNSRDEISVSADRLHELVGDDIYSNDAVNLFQSGNDVADRESFYTIKGLKGKPNAAVVIYRAIPKGLKGTHFGDGDWVTLSKEYAIEHGESNLDGHYTIASMKAKASDLYWNGDSINEFGYDTGKGHYRSQTANRNLITYTDSGRIIPLSKRFDAKKTDVRYSRRNADMSKKERLLFNEMRELKVGVAAYNKLTELIKPAAESLGLANGYHNNFNQYMRDYRASLNSSGRTAKQIADIGAQMTIDERNFLSDVLEKELPDGAEVSSELQELAGTIREIFNQQSDDLVSLNMLSADSAERFRDTYLPRMYSKPDMLPDDIRKMQKQFNRALYGGLGKSISGTHLKGRGIFKKVNRGEIKKYKLQGFEIREDDGKSSEVLMWRDYTREERNAMGEERDAMLRFSVGYVKTQSDIAKAMLFKRIATDENLASATHVEGWQEIPQTQIAGTGGVKRYGALAGMWVHPDVYSALQNQFYVDGAIQKIWRSMLGWWKITKTVYNPVAHVNNVVSNIIMSTVAGSNAKDIWAGAIAVKNKNALYQEALEYGLVGEAVDVAGIREMFTGLNNVSDGQMTELLITRALKRADKLSGQIVGKTAKMAENAYRAEDEVFRLALYKKARDKGMQPKEAVNWALTFMFDYSEVPPTIRKVRDTGILPFVSYTYKAIPAIARLALTRPHRMLAVTSLMYGINALSYLMLGGEADEEEERENMPDYQKGFTSFGTPKLIRLPFNDSDGKPMFIDVYRWLPLGDFADTQNQMGGIPLPQWLTPNGPVVNHAFALLGNKDTFTGKELTKDYMSGAEKANIYGKWIAQQWLPSSVGVPYSYHTNNVLDGIKNQFEGTIAADILEDMGYTGTDSRGNGKQLYRAALGSVGVKIRGENPKEMAERKNRFTKYQIREVQADMRRIARDRRLNDSTRESKLNTRREYIEELTKRINDKKSETD